MLVGNLSEASVPFNFAENGFTLVQVTLFATPFSSLPLVSFAFPLNRYSATNSGPCDSKLIALRFSESLLWLCSCIWDSIKKFQVPVCDSICSVLPDAVASVPENASSKTGSLLIEPVYAVHSLSSIVPLPTLPLPLSSAQTPVKHTFKKRTIPSMPARIVLKNFRGVPFRQFQIRPIEKSDFIVKWGKC